LSDESLEVRTVERVLDATSVLRLASTASRAIAAGRRDAESVFTLESVAVRPRLRVLDATSALRLESVAVRVGP